MKKIRGLDERDGVYRIEPQDAAGLLACDIGKNRKIRQAVANKYAARMSAGEWVLTGEPIILTHNGRFPADGRHRLVACVTSNRAFDAVVLHCAGETYKWESMGQGRSRTLDDVYGANGEKYHKLLATAVRYIIRHDRARDGGYSMFSQTSKDKNNWKDIENRVGEAYLDAHPTLREWIAEFGSAFSTEAQVVPYGAACAAYCLIRRVDTKAMDFFGGLMTGENLSASDARFVLRKRLYRESNERTVGGAPNSTEYNVALILKAYKASKSRAKVSAIGFKSGEQYPFMDGAW